MLGRLTNQQGFTLFELLTTLGVAAILATLAVPAYQSFIQQEKHARTVNQLQSLYKFSRSEAIKREAVVALKPVPSQTNNWQVTLPGSDNKVLRHFALNDSAITVSGLEDIQLSSNGNTSAQSIEVKDPKAYAATKWLCIFPSGQLIVQSSQCPNAGA
jgi:type IV fimbrial biogenesis protein FimT